MRALYVRRTQLASVNLKRASVWLLKDLISPKHKRRNNRFYGQDGFFEASIASVCNIDSCTLRELRRRLKFIHHDYDVLIINWNSVPRKADRRKLFSFISANDNLVKVLLHSKANESEMPDDATLDMFDLVFKREHYRDLEKYPISDVNRQKIRTTMLACPLIEVSHFDDLAAFDPLSEFRNLPETASEHDVFFAGKTTNSMRMNVWEKVANSNFKYVGGLQPHKTMTEREKRYRVPRFKRADYIDTVRKTRVNLALKGSGSFTYRHLELLCLRAFTLSSPSVRDVVTPLALEENKHYTTFNDLDDMVEKIRYYCEHDEERRKIGSAGQALFEREYDFNRHGQYILDQIRPLL